MIGLPRSRRIRGAVLAIALSSTWMQSACYEYSQVPSESIQVVPGVSFSFSLSDQGRAAMADKLGPSVAAGRGAIHWPGSGSIRRRRLFRRIVHGGSLALGGRACPNPATVRNRYFGAAAFQRKDRAGDCRCDRCSSGAHRVTQPFRKRRTGARGFAARRIELRSAAIVGIRKSSRDSSGPSLVGPGVSCGRTSVNVLAWLV